MSDSIHYNVLRMTCFVVCSGHKSSIKHKFHPNNFTVVPTTFTVVPTTFTVVPTTFTVVPRTFTVACGGKILVVLVQPKSVHASTTNKPAMMFDILGGPCDPPFSQKCPWCAMGCDAWMDRARSPLFKINLIQPGDPGRNGEFGATLLKYQAKSTSFNQINLPFQPKSTTVNLLWLKTLHSGFSYAIAFAPRRTDRLQPTDAPQIRNGSQRIRKPHQAVQLGKILWTGWCLGQKWCYVHIDHKSIIVYCFPCITKAISSFFACFGDGFAVSASETHPEIHLVGGTALLFPGISQ